MRPSILYRVSYGIKIHNILIEKLLGGDEEELQREKQLELYGIVIYKRPL